MKLTWYIISREVFQFSLVTYLLLLLIETIKEGFVSYFFNLNILLIIVLVSGILMALLTPEHIPGKKKEQHKVTSFDIQFIFAVSVGSSVLVYYKTQELGNLSFILALITAFIVFFLSLLILLDNDTAQNETP